MIFIIKNTVNAINKTLKDVNCTSLSYAYCILGLSQESGAFFELDNCMILFKVSAHLKSLKNLDRIS